ncbi:MAG: metal-dependent hydrolase [Nanoarchaeota archaeon]|nr:metal-dependent hydrolase [Nanoarchaeota archaeon]
MNLLTHVIFGLALSECLSLNIFYVILGAVIPDFDYFFGVGHRTVMHSLLFIIIISFLIYYKNKRKGISLFIGFSSHLILDTLTTQGVMLLWPLKTFFSYNLFNSTANAPNFTVIIISFVLIINKDIILEKLSNFKSSNVRIATFSIIVLLLIPAIFYTWYEDSKCFTASINDLLKNPDYYNKACVIVNGVVCSIVEDYTSSGSVEYKIFNICSEEDELLVWSLKSITPYLEYYDNITITGIFTTKYYESSGYELYMIKSVRKN